MYFHETALPNPACCQSPSGATGFLTPLDDVWAHHTMRHETPCQCRRAAQLREKFCFTCACERCCEESPARRPSTPGEGGPEHARSPPAWFLSAMAPAGLPDEAPAEDVRKGMVAIRDALAELAEQAQQLFLRDGRAAQAWAVLEAGLFKARPANNASHHLCTLRC